jgi:hypothetical protein
MTVFKSDVEEKILQHETIKNTVPVLISLINN